MQTESEHCNLTLISKLCFEQYCTHSVAAYWPRHQSAHSLCERTMVVHRNHLIAGVSQDGGLLTEISVAHQMCTILMEILGVSRSHRHAPYVSESLIGKVATMHSCACMRRTGIVCPVSTGKISMHSGWNCSTFQPSFAWGDRTKPLLEEA